MTAALASVAPVLAAPVASARDETTAPTQWSASVSGDGFELPAPVFGDAGEQLAAARAPFAGIAFLAISPELGEQTPPASEPVKPPQDAPPPSPPQQKPPRPTEPIEVPVVSERSPEHTGFKALVRDTISDFKHLPSRDTAMWLTIGGGLTVAVLPLDDQVNEQLQGDGWSTFFAPGKYLGYGWVQIGAAIGTWAIGRAVDKRGRAAHLGLDLLRAQIVTQTLTYTLKVAVGRERPDGSGNDSFPSGHASTTFATATVLERHLGWRWAVPTYIAASYVAASRLSEDRHNLSDVVFGATVGLVSGRTVTRHGRHSYALIPISGPRGGVGIGIARVAD
jgi:membrane-associated phospholipid phosphatase